MHLESQAEVGSISRSLFKYPIDTVGLRFEFDRVKKHQQLKKEEFPKAPKGKASVLIYVDSVREFVSRITDSGFQVYVKPIEVNDWVKSAVVLDPNGLKVRLIETDKVQFNRSKSSGRLGYVSVDVNEYGMIEKAVKFYEESYDAKNTANNSSTQLTTTHHYKMRKRHEEQKGKNNFKAKSFRMVDIERFVEDLTTYVWLGNSVRRKTATLCLLHKISRKTIYKSGVSDQTFLKYERSVPKEKERLFLGMSFHVVDLDEAVANFTRTGLVPESRLVIKAAPGFLRSIEFNDPAFVAVEVTDGSTGAYQVQALSLKSSGKNSFETRTAAVKHLMENIGMFRSSSKR